MMIFAFCLFIAITIIMTTSEKLRYLCFLVFIFLSLSQLPLRLGLSTEQSLRLPLAMALLLSNIRQVIREVYMLRKKGILFFLILWTILLVLAWWFSDKGNISHLYATVGNLIFFFLVVSYTALMSRREFSQMLAVVIVAQIPGLLINIPAYRNIIERMGFYWGTVYHQRAGHAAVFLLPFLLFTLSRTKNFLLKLAVWASIIAAFFITASGGARTPLIVFGLVLIFWWRKLKYTLVIAGVVALAFIYFISVQESDYIRDRYDRMFQVLSTGDVSYASNVEFRFEHLQLGIRAFLRAPVFGHGHNSWTEIMSEEVGILGYDMAPHNEPLRILVENGGAGLVVFLLLMWNCIRGLSRKPGKDYWNMLSYIFFVSVVAHLFLNLFHNALFTRHFYFMIAISALFSIKMYKDKDLETSPVERVPGTDDREVTI